MSGPAGGAAASPPPAGARLLRTLHLHRTPARLAGRLEAELARLAARFAPVSEDDLAGLMAGRAWERPRPPLLVALFNGYREHAEVAAPILERAGLAGWFFVPTAFVDTPPPDQLAFAAAHGMRLRDVPPAGPRVAMSWEEVAAVGRRHVVASHTRSHVRLGPELSPAQLDDELAGSRRELEARLGRPVRTFAALGAGGLGEHPEVDAALGRSGYEFLYAAHAIQRLPPAA